MLFLEWSGPIIIKLMMVLMIVLVFIGLLFEFAVTFLFKLVEFC